MENLQTLITCQIGWVTCDNASNNDTMFKFLTTLLNKRKIKINMGERRIQLVHNMQYNQILTLL
jgi:hypothetical protein